MKKSSKALIVLVLLNVGISSAWSQKISDYIGTWAASEADWENDMPVYPEIQIHSEDGSEYVVVFGLVLSEEGGHSVYEGLSAITWQADEKGNIVRGTAVIPGTGIVDNTGASTVATSEQSYTFFEFTLLPKKRIQIKRYNFYEYKDNDKPIFNDWYTGSISYYGPNKTK